MITEEMMRKTASLINVFMLFTLYLEIIPNGDRNSTTSGKQDHGKA
jgi:hypothetical protein